jgi:hypothetical protein
MTRVHEVNKSGIVSQFATVMVLCLLSPSAKAEMIGSTMGAASNFAPAQQPVLPTAQQNLSDADQCIANALAITHMDPKESCESRVLISHDLMAKRISYVMSLPNSDIQKLATRYFMNNKKHEDDVSSMDPET